MVDDARLHVISQRPPVAVLSGSEADSDDSVGVAQQSAWRLRRGQFLGLALLLGLLVWGAAVRTVTGRAVAAPMPTLMQVSRGVLDVDRNQLRNHLTAVSTTRDLTPYARANATSAKAFSAVAQPGHDAGARSIAKPISPPQAVAVSPADALGQGSACTSQSTRTAINTATVEQLDALPGVGPVLASRIVAWRNQHHGFSDIHELQEVPGIGPAKFARLRTQVRL